MFVLVLVASGDGGGVGVGVDVDAGVIGVDVIDGGGRGVIVMVAAMVMIIICIVRKGVILVVRSCAAPTVDWFGTAVGTTSCDCDRGWAISARASLGAVG